jgi:hypothetical protein
LPEELSMAISSAGSLCAGQRELPRGVNREYNLVAIDDTYTKARVHVREMTQGNHFGRAGRGAFRMDGFMEVRWALPAGRAGGAPTDGKKFATDTILRAEELLRGGRATDALMALEKLKHPLSGHARNLFIEAARTTGDSKRMVGFIQHPQSITEFIELFGAMLTEKLFDDAASLLRRADEFNVDAGTLEGLRSRLEMRMVMGKY